MAIICNAAKKCHASLVAMESQLEFIDVLDGDCLLEPSLDSGEQCKKKKRRALNKQDHLAILHTIIMQYKCEHPIIHHSRANSDEIVRPRLQ